MGGKSVTALSKQDIAMIAIAINELSSASHDDIRFWSRKPLFICQEHAYSVYGEANVKAFVSAGLVEKYKRVRKIEYRVSQLEAASSRKQIIPLK